ncbi:hypothetical protein MLD38_037956 [Melastoma candidum]|uniref:Uncharacterized protein n=1 Tax=Melastoma candidum TaxID=119954 RepID=A0ACB9KY14_9MYRT|nr:hypothetical protein MLD38_037956 [Melastoma candidum]
MTPLLATYGLLDHVEGRIIVPTKTIINPDGVTTANPDYLRWESRDNFALTCVMLAVTEEIGVTIVTSKTSHEAWTRLGTTFVRQTAAQEDLLDQQWRDLEKEQQSMAVYINSVKQQALQYAQIGKPKSQADINRRIYTGLPIDWEPLILAQAERMLELSIEELESLLVGHEECRLYAASHNETLTPGGLSSEAPLSGILGSAPAAAHLTDVWD